MQATRGMSTGSAWKKIDQGSGDERADKTQLVTLSGDENEGGESVVGRRDEGERGDAVEEDEELR